MQLISGQKVALSQWLAAGDLEVGLAWQADFAVDVACFGVDSEGKLSDDRYFIFYNQLVSPEGALRKAEDADHFTIALDKLPAKIERLIFTAAIDGEQTMRELREGHMTFRTGTMLQGEYVLKGSDFAQEKAIILAEIYRRDGSWRLGAVGKGFDGGLSALLAHFGGEEIKEGPAQAPAPAVSLSKGEAVQKVVLAKAPRLVDLTKKAVVSLEKKKLTGIVAKVVLVMDVSGSMNKQYKTGRVQRILDKVLPLALLFDDDGTLESWTFAERFRELEEVTLDNIDGYIDNANGGWRRWNVGGTNDEAGVIEAIYLKHRQEKLPVYVIFISDGGVHRNKPIKDIITTAAYAPIFWQFIGISGKNYGILEKLDEMGGRYVDNANFFALDDIDDISDEALYDRLMNEFPLWLEAAKAKNLL